MRTAVQPIEVALRAWFLKDATIAGLVGTRIYPLHLPLDAATPAITYALVSDPLQQAPGHYRQRIQFSIWAEGATSAMQGFPVAREVREAIRTLVDGRAGDKYPCEIEDSTYRYKIISIEFAGGPDLTEPESKLAHIPVDLIVEYWEGIAVEKPADDVPPEDPEEEDNL
ncbi:MAG TPA: DUF3168 domain-containing protein [Methanoculleus sp.]|nr:DUF3168 domain-containing protein [Methanoculleus sp.]